jgi:hypothetical protein
VWHTFREEGGKMNTWKENIVTLNRVLSRLHDAVEKLEHGLVVVAWQQVTDAIEEVKSVKTELESRE